MKVLHKQRGQVAVFYALLIPIVFVLGSMGLELGWYYLNVSRLQNAADAAVLVGAKALVEQEKIGGEDNPVHNYKVKLVEKYPANKPADKDEWDKLNMTIAHNEALDYAKKNLADNSVGYTTPSLFSVAEAKEVKKDTFHDGYARGNNPEVTMESSLYTNGEDYYYVVGISENVQHFFIGYLDDMNAGVVAVALISKNINNGGETPDDVDEIELVFNANGGTFENGKETSDPKYFKSPSKMDDGEFSNPITPGKPPTNSDSNLYFKGWSTSANPDENGIIVNFIEDGKPLSKTEMEKIFGNNTSVTLYAVWVKNDNPGSTDPPSSKPQNNKTLWEQMQYLIAKNVYPYYWYAAVNKYGQDPINNRFNNVKVYYQKGANDVWHKATTVNHSAETEQVWVETGDPNDEAVWVKTGKTTDYFLETGKSSDSKRYVEITREEYNKYNKQKYNYCYKGETHHPLTYHYVYCYIMYGQYGYYKYGHYETVETKPAWTETIEGYYEPKTDNNVSRNYFVETLDLGDDKMDGTNSAPSPHSYAREDIATSTHYFIDFWQADGSLAVQGKNSRDKDVTASTERSEMAKGKLRTHSLFNVNTTYASRAGYGDDPLYCRIEAEPYKSEATPIRQIVININKDNTADGLRPLFIFYDGPDARTSMSTSSIKPGHLTPDQAQPVILNLNADFKGVLFMPDIPVIINGNNHKFEGFIIAKEYRYLDPSNGTPVQYSTTGKTDKIYASSKIRVDSDGNVKSIKSTGETALALWNNGTNDFGLNQTSCFKMFKASSGVNYAYIHYDFDTLELDKTPFYDDITGELIDIRDANNNRIAKWDDVKLYGYVKNAGFGYTVGTKVEIPKEITNSDAVKNVIKALTGSKKLQNASSLDNFRGIVLLDSDDNSTTSDNKPIEIVDAANNPIYFCASYVKLAGSYNVITLDKMIDGTRSPKEFLLTKSDAQGKNVTNSEDWT